MSSVCELWYFMEKIKNYEPGIHRLIKYLVDINTYTFKTNIHEPGLVAYIKKDIWINTYTFKTKEELQESIDLWNKSFSLEKYGHISYWDVSQITDMSWMFYSAKEFNQPIGD